MIKGYKRIFQSLLFLFAIVIVASSCVTNRKVQYMHREDVSVDDVPLDSIVRTYNVKPFDYQIQPYDVLFIRIESLSDDKFDFFKKVQEGAGLGGNQGNNLQGIVVDPDGDIEYPVVGKIKAMGLTTNELSQKLQTIAGQYVKDPVVKVRLMTYKFTVLGEVGHEGTQNTTNPRLSLPECIGMAGGMTELANRSQIKVIRQQGDSVQVFYVNMLDEKTIESPYYYVHPNDVIVVPPLKQRTFRKYFNPNMAIFVSTVSTILFLIALITR